MFSTRNTQPVATDADDDGDAGPAPRFPTYLLPSVSIPFRRRRQSSQIPSNSSLTSDGSLLREPYTPPEATYMPSLCTSPTDSTRSIPFDSPPTPSFWPSRFSFSQESRRPFVEPLNVSKLARTQPDTIRCSTCSTDLAFCSQIVSKGFTGRYGRAYLVSPPDQMRKGRKAGDLINVKVGKPETRQLVTGSHVVADINCAMCHAKVGWKYVDAKDESQKYKVGKFILETQRVMDYRSWEDVLVPEVAELGIEPDPEPSKPVDDAEPIVFNSDDEDECEDLFSGTWDPEVVAKRRRRKVNKRPKQVARE